MSKKANAGDFGDVLGGMLEDFLSESIDEFEAECPSCGASFKLTEADGKCPECGAPVKVISR